MKRAALYARVSTEEQARHGYSIGAQIDALRAYAAQQHYRIVGEYVDEGISARKSYKARPSLLRLLDDVEADRIDVILFVKLDRWFRNVAAYYQVQPILEAHNVAWQATLEDYETVTASGRFKVNIMLSVAQDEADRASERIRFVFENQRAKGERINGSHPYGFRVENKSLVPDPEKMELVKWVYDTYIDNRSLLSTRSAMEEQYGVSRSYITIRRMLSEKAYIPYVGKDTFVKAQEILATRSVRRSPEARNVYLFSGIIYCKECGGRFRGRSRNGTNYYNCSRHASYGSSHCSNRRHVPEPAIEQFLLANLRQALTEYNLKIESEQKPPVNTEKIRRKMEKLKDLYLDDLISREVYERDYRALEKQLDVPYRREQPVNIEEAMTAISIYQELPAEKKKALWGRMLKRIEIDSSGHIFLIP